MTDELPNVAKCYGHAVYAALLFAAMKLYACRNNMSRASACLCSTVDIYRLVAASSTMSCLVDVLDVSQGICFICEYMCESRYKSQLPIFLPLSAVSPQYSFHI